MTRSRSEERWGPYPLVLAGAVAGVGVVAFGHPMSGALIMGLSLLIGMVFRLLRGDRAAGRLAVRDRMVDVMVMAAMGGLIVIAVAFLVFYKR
ncbi:DUF3017 domain-containing protein [Sinosporangium siamense]|uniref:DUF3017 domain-containing protein n=1 Tax=Sinosporangium siamense TaxID=1367973 RepID=A0A919V4V3_9ACTN|nr:DUF3017 domain-containing protein [Sinosporangium siamense]GII90888.1 hypothetical protein Ssi02_11190 [Sinosporangium siamense]